LWSLVPVVLGIADGSENKAVVSGPRSSMMSIDSITVGSMSVMLLERVK
jgi:hypothetical protein